MKKSFLLLSLLIFSLLQSAQAYDWQKMSAIYNHCPSCQRSYPAAQSDYIGQCRSVMDTVCRSTPVEDQVRCGQNDYNKNDGAWKVLTSCGAGVFNSMTDILHLGAEIIWWSWGQLTSSQKRMAAGGTILRVGRNSGGYIYSQYQRGLANPRCRNKFSGLKEMCALEQTVLTTGNLIYSKIEHMVKKANRNYDVCLNHEAQMRVRCRLISDIFTSSKSAAEFIKASAVSSRAAQHTLEVIRRGQTEQIILPITERGKSAFEISDKLHVYVEKYGHHEEAHKLKHITFDHH